MDRVIAGVILFPLLGLVYYFGFFGPAYPEEVRTVEFASSQSGDVETMRIDSVEGNRPWHQQDVAWELHAVVNSGVYNIVAVQTTYEAGYLASAEVLYDPVSPGEGNKIRVVLIHGKKYYWPEREKEITPRFEDFIGSGYDIQEINTIYGEGYLIAAEVYYHSRW